MVKEQNLRLTFKSRSLFQETVKYYETKMQRRVKHWIYKEMLNMTARSCLEEFCFSFSRKYVTWRKDQAADSVEKLSLSRREEKSQGRVRWSLLSCLVCMQCFGEKKKSSSSSELFSQSFRSSQLFSTLATVSFVGLLRRWHNEEVSFVERLLLANCVVAEQSTKEKRNYNCFFFSSRKTLITKCLHECSLRLNSVAVEQLTYCLSWRSSLFLVLLVVSIQFRLRSVSSVLFSRRQEGLCCFFDLIYWLFEQTRRNCQQHHKLHTHTWRLDSLQDKVSHVRVFIGNSLLAVSFVTQKRHTLYTLFFLT